MTDHHLFTADEYGDSEDLLGKWFAANPDKRKDIFLCTKFAIQRDKTPGSHAFSVDTSPEYCRKAIEKSLGRLGLPYVDLYYVHRLDKVTPIEKTMEVLVELKNAGKIKYIGLSDCSAESLRRAHAVHPISCIQVEYNPGQIDIEKVGLLEAARALGVAIVAYSPLGNGFLGGTLRQKEDFSGPGDPRGVLPWLNPDNFEKNQLALNEITEIAKEKGVTVAQLTLAWILAQGDDVFAIPGTTKISRLEENLASLSVELSREEERKIREVAQKIAGGSFHRKTGYSFADTPAL